MKEKVLLIDFFSPVFLMTLFDKQNEGLPILDSTEKAMKFYYFSNTVFKKTGSKLGFFSVKTIKTNNYFPSLIVR